MGPDQAEQIISRMKPGDVVAIPKAKPAPESAPTARGATPTNPEADALKKGGPMQAFRDRQARNAAKKEVRVEEARHLDYQESGDSKEVKLNKDTVRELAAIVHTRINAINQLAAQENTIRSTFEDTLRVRGQKWIEWDDYMSGQRSEPPKEAITKSDLDLVYTLLLDETLQRGAFLGVEVDPVNPNRLQRLFSHIPLPMFQHPEYRRTDHPFQPSAMRAQGLITDYVAYIYADAKKSQVVFDDLTRIDRARAHLIEAMTGHDMNERVWNHVNWRPNLEQLFARENSGLILHNEILQVLEGSANMRPLLDQYGSNNVIDLLIDFDDPNIRIRALSAYHDALSATIAHRFKEQGVKITSDNFERRKEHWQRQGLIENARKNRDIVGEERALEERDKATFENIRAEIQKIKDQLVSPDKTTGLSKRISTLSTAATALNQYITDHDLTPLRDELNGGGGVRESLRLYNSGRLPAPLPPELVATQTGITNTTDAINDLPARALPPAELRAETARLETQLREYRKLYSEALDRTKKSLSERQTQLEKRIKEIEDEQENKKKAVDTAYEFVENDMPNLIASLRDVYNRLNQIVTNPPAVLAGRVAEIEEQRDNIGLLRNFITADVHAIIRKAAGNQQTVAYAAALNFQLNVDTFADHLRNVDTALRQYPGWTEAQPAEDVDRRNAIDLVLTLVDRPQAKTGEAAKEPVFARVVSSLMAEMQSDDRRILNQLFLNHNLDALRNFLCNQPEITSNDQLRDPILWQRVFSDQFIIQSMTQWLTTMEVPLPPAAGPDIDLTNPDDAFRQAVIERVSSSHLELARFLTFMLERRLADAADVAQRQYDITQAEYVPLDDENPIDYFNTPVPIRSRAPDIFGVEDSEEFIQRMREQKELTRYLQAEGARVNNIAGVEPLYDESVRLPGNNQVVRLGRGLRIVTSDDDPFVWTDADGRQRRLTFDMRLRAAPVGISHSLHVRADPTLEGLTDAAGRPLNIGVLDRRWVDLLPLVEQPLGRQVEGIAGLANEINTLLPGVPAVEFTNKLTQSIANYFINRTPQQRRRTFPRFADAEVVPAAFPGLDNIGIHRITMDARGNLIAVNEDNERIAFSSILQLLDVPATEQLLTLIGQEVLGILGV